MYYCHVGVLVHVISVPLCVQNTCRSIRKYFVLILTILGDLADAVRDYSLKFGLYHSLFEWFNPLYKKDEASGFKTQNFVKVGIELQKNYIFASQVFDSLTLIYPLADLANVYMMCPEIPAHPVKLLLVNMKTI